MGCYVNPPGTKTKEMWLHENARQVTLVEAANHNDYKDNFLVVLISNFSFTAGLVCYCEEEKKALFDDDSGRPMKFYIASREKLNTVSPLYEYQAEVKEIR